MPAALTKSVAAASPVTLAEAKAHLRVVGTAEDAYLQSLVDGATAEAEAACGRGFGLSTWTFTLDAFPAPASDWPIGCVPGLWSPAWWLAGQSAGAIDLPVRPAAAVTAVRYYDTAGVRQTADPATYWAALQTGRLVPKAGWPATELGRPEAVEIEFTAGDPAATLPPQARQAILLIVGSRYMHRGDEVVANDPTGSAAVPVAAQRLLGQLWDGRM